MATTEELLAEAEADSIEYIIVDPEARTLTVPSSETIFGVYSENDVERKYFKCPRYVVGEKVDLLECTIKVLYITANGDLGKYVCDDISEYDDDTIIFSWLLGKDLFDKNTSTTISFAIKASRSTGDNVFATRKATGTTYDTIEEGSLYTQYSDFLLQVLSYVDDEIDYTDDDSIVEGIKSLVDLAEASTGSGETDLAGQIAALIEGYGRGETISVVDLSAVDVYVADFMSDEVTVEAGAIDIYERNLVS